MEEKILVSMCLAGIDCNYKGSSKPNKKVIDMVKSGYAVLVCPEQLGGLTTPRAAAERRYDRVITSNGDDVTKQFQRGAEYGLKIAQMYGCKRAILKARSPSCGSGENVILSGDLVKRDGVFAELLKKNGIEVKSEEEL